MTNLMNLEKYSDVQFQQVGLMMLIQWTYPEIDYQLFKKYKLLDETET